MWVTLAIKKAAMGFQAAGDVAGEWATPSMPATSMSTRASSSGLLGAAEQAAAFGLSVGSVGAHRIGRLIDAVGEDLLQGVLAGGIMHYHGMALAADTLAVDRAHRASPAMTPPSLGCADSRGDGGWPPAQRRRQNRSILRMRRRQARGPGRSGARRHLARPRGLPQPVPRPRASRPWPTLTRARQEPPAAPASRPLAPVGAACRPVVGAQEKHPGSPHVHPLGHASTQRPQWSGGDPGGP